MTTQAGNRSILIIDDEETSHYLAQRLLQGTGYRIVHATGMEATERARFEAPTLLLLDLGMPERSGFIVLDQLKSDSATQGIPVGIHSSKALTDADYARLGGRYAAILPKGPEGRQAATCRRSSTRSNGSMAKKSPALVWAWPSAVA